MNLICTHLIEGQAARSVRLLKIDGCPPYVSYFEDLKLENNKYIASRWKVDGYEWEIRFYPMQLGIYEDGFYDMALELVFLSDACGNHVTANLICRLLDPRGICQPSAEKMILSKSFQRPSDSSGKVSIMPRHEAQESGYLSKNGSVTMECTITVFKDQEGNSMPSSNLQKDLGELLWSGCGADVTFNVSGESLAAHKNVLAARSPVFKAEFFGEMKEKTSRCIEIKDMEAAVFRGMLHFIYTDKVPELDEKKETATAMAQHLLVAADRYGLDQLKLICERKIALGIDTGTVATTLILAELYGCSHLKAKCVDFITGGSEENLDAVLATEGFKSLEASVLTELLKAAHAGRIKKRRHMEAC